AGMAGIVGHVSGARAVYLPVSCGRTSTLFPYTTLFRSGIGVRELGLPGLKVHGDEEQPRALSRVHRRVDGLVARSTNGADRKPGDRKSTRLNSSHVKISYAVFCLKKKNWHRSELMVSQV